MPRGLVPPPCTALPAEADVIIIGAGLTGCATAFWLQRLYGRSSVIVDARGLAGGATGRNGGHLWPNPNSDFERATVEELLSFIEAEGIECDLTHGGAVALERRAPEEGVEYHNAAGDPEEGDGEDEDWGETPLLGAAECATRLQTDAFAGATLYDGARQFYPAKVVAALLRASGSTLFAPVRVLSLEAVAQSAAEAAEALAAWSGSGSSSWQRQSSPPLLRLEAPSRLHSCTAALLCTTEQRLLGRRAAALEPLRGAADSTAFDHSRTRGPQGPRA